MNPELQQHAFDTLEPEKFEELLDKVYSELVRLTLGPNTPDPYMRQFAQAYGELLMDNGKIKQDLKEFFEVRGTDIRIEYAVQVIFRAVHAYLSQHDAILGYPKSFTVDKWKEAIARLTYGSDQDSENFHMNTLTRNVQSNVSERHKSLPVIFYSNRERFGDEITRLDIGSSIKRGLKKEIEGGFSPVLEAQGADIDTFNRTIRLPIPIRHALAVDIEDVERSSVREWAEACTLMPKERLNKRLVDEYRRLDRTDYGDIISFVNSDFIEHTYPWESHPSAEQRYDVVTMFTFLYMLTPEEREVAIRRAKRTTRKNGLLVVQDFASIDDTEDAEFEEVLETPVNEQHRLRFFKNIYGGTYRYRTFVYDPMQPEKGFQSVFEFDKGRCERVRLALGRKTLRGTVQKNIAKVLRADQ